MKTQGDILLTRDCDAVQIPSGHPLVLPAGMSVVVTQSLGGSYTVVVNGNMFRIEGNDADALGLQAAGKKNAAAAEPVTLEQVEKEI